MINILSAILFSFSANIDNIALGIAYGIKKIHISNIKNFLITLCTSFITIVSMKLGDYIFSFFNERISNSIGSIALILIGTFGILKILYNKYIKKKSIGTENFQYKKLEFKELMSIVFTLSCNNIAVGFAASVAGIDLITTLISTFIFSFFFLYIGNKLGKNMINKVLSKYSDIIGSLILILIGVIQLFFKPTT